MSPGNEIEEIGARASGAVASMITAASRLAVVLIELHVERLREAAQRQQEQGRQIRDATRAAHQGDSAVWRAAMRPQWWRQAGAEDISRVWRAASTWQHVDPRAAEARQVVVERLAERGVKVDPASASWAPSPDDVAWLSDALDQAAAERGARASAQSGAGRGAQRTGGGEGRDAAVVEGEVADPQSAQESAAGSEPRRMSEREREQRAAGHVRTVWPAERADRVFACDAWGVLAHQLDQLQEQGEDVDGLLRAVPDFVDRAHTPAAFTYRSIEDSLDGRADLGDHSGPGLPAVLAATERGPEVTDEAGQRSGALLAQVSGGREDDIAAAALSAASPPTPSALQEHAGGPKSAAGTASPPTADSAAEAGDAQAGTIATKAYPLSTREAVATTSAGARPGAASEVPAAHARAAVAASHDAQADR